MSDSQPGNVGLDKLRKLAQSFSITVIPTLPTLVPFLELSSNQDYLVNRIKVLAKGGSMSEFKWNSGGSHNGKEWDSSLPTDTAVLYKVFLFKILINTSIILKDNIILDHNAFSFNLYGYSVRSTIKSARC